MKIITLLLLFVLFINSKSIGQIITTIAGTGAGGSSGDGGLATAATFADPGGVAFDKKGNLYIATGLNHNVRKVDTAGIITTFAGNGTQGYSGDGGMASAAELYSPAYIAADINGNIYISDPGNWRIRKVDTSGIITTFAGNGMTGYNGDNIPATSASIYAPQGLNFDNMGNLFVADYNNFRIRKIDTAGIITTVAGNGTFGYSGDGGPATAAELNSPTDVIPDAFGNLYIADWQNNRVRLVGDESGIITTYAGNGTATYAGDDIPATSVQISVWTMALDDSNNLFIADDYNERIYEVNAVTGIINTIAGTGVGGYSGDGGPATTAEVYLPEGLAFDACGNLYIGDLSNRRVRKVTYPPILTIPTISISSIATASAGTLVTITATVTNAGSNYNIEWFDNGVLFNTTTVPSVTYTKQAGIDTITARVVPTGYGCYDSTTSSPDIITVNTEGVNTLPPQVGIIAYPNPANGMLHIDDVSAPTSYRIQNIIGSVMQQGNLKAGSNNISIQSLPSGMYIVEVNDEEGERTIKKIIKQ